ncbi:retrovirus-related pol polyprotein from transposon TNT 1-94, partial [Tanacetum coccineum]
NIDPTSAPELDRKTQTTIVRYSTEGTVLGPQTRYENPSPESYGSCPPTVSSLFQDDNLVSTIPVGEFCLVTGLKFGVSLDGQPIRGKHVEALINSKAFKKLDDNDAVSLCCVGILQLVLLGLEDRHPVPNWILRRWPALYATQPTDEVDNKSYSLTGFLWAFKAWILKSFRAATNDYYTRYCRLLRIVVWSSKNKFYLRMLKPFLHGQLPVERLVPDEIEARSRCGTLKGSIQGNKSDSYRHGWKQPNYANCFWYMQRGNRYAAIALAVQNEFPLAYHANDYDTNVIYDIAKVAGKIQLFVSHHQIYLSMVLILNDGSLEEAFAAHYKLQIYIDHLGVDFIIAKYIFPNASLAEMMNHVITNYTSDSEDNKREVTQNDYTFNQMVEWAEQEHFEDEKTKLSCPKIDLSTVLKSNKGSSDKSFQSLCYLHQMHKRKKIHMLAPKCSTYNGRPTFANPRYLKKAQSEKPCLYEIPYDTSDLANRFAPDREETMTLANESRSKLNKDYVKPYDYTRQNSLYEIFKAPSLEYLYQLERAKEVRKTMWRKPFVRTKPNIAKNVAFLPVSKSISKSRQVFNDMTFNINQFREIVDQAWFKHTSDYFWVPTAKDMEVLIKTLLMPLSIKTQNDSFRFEHELKTEMHEDYEYVKSLEKEVDELESEKANFSNIYDLLLEECVSKDVTCSYLHSLSDLNAYAELQCLYLHKVKECECLAQKFLKQTESVNKEVHNKLLKSFAKLENHSISLELALQQCKEQIKNNSVCKENRSIIISTHGKMAYHIINDRKPSIKHLHIFGYICYITRDGENLDKMKEKGDPCVMVGYSTQSKGYRVYNKRTHLIVESIHIKFDEIKQKMSVENVSSGLVPQGQKVSDYDNSDPV